MESLQGFLDNYPAIANILAIMGALRLFLKPVFSVLNAYVLSTPSVKDDAFLNKIQTNKIWIWALYILDWATSVKIKR